VNCRSASGGTEIEALAEKSIAPSWDPIRTPRSSFSDARSGAPKASSCPFNIHSPSRSSHNLWFYCGRGEIESKQFTWPFRSKTLRLPAPMYHRDVYCQSTSVRTHDGLVHPMNSAPGANHASLGAHGWRFPKLVLSIRGGRGAYFLADSWRMPVSPRSWL